MEKKTVDAYKKKLLARKVQIAREVKTLLDQDTQTPFKGVDVGDLALISYEKEFLFQLSESEREVFTLIKEALQRIEKGSYGLCLACGKEIQKKRLDAVPWARHCLDCQALQEKGLLE